MNLQCGASVETRLYVNVFSGHIALVACVYSHSCKDQLSPGMILCTMIEKMLMYNFPGFQMLDRKSVV